MAPLHDRLDSFSAFAPRSPENRSEKFGPKNRPRKQEMTAPKRRHPNLVPSTQRRKVNVMMTSFRDTEDTHQRQICRYHKYGVCKFRENCPDFHLNRICPGDCSNVDECNMRHPKLCRIFRDNGFCSFPNCMYAHKPTQESLIRDCSRSVLELNNRLYENFSQLYPYLLTEFKHLFTCVVDEFKGLLHDSRSSFISEVPQIIDSRTDDVSIHDPEVSACSPVSSEGDGPSESPLSFPVPLDPYEEAIPTF